MCKVSVVIPNYNGISCLADCLKSLENQTMTDFETIVVDNGSKDGSQLAAKEAYPQIRLIPLDENEGFCRAVNVGIRAAKAPFVILLNNDTKAAPEFVEALYTEIRKIPNCFSCAAKMLQMAHPDRIDDAGDYYCALGWAFADGKDKPEQEYTKAKEIFASCGGAAIYRKEVFEQIGYFDERHFAYLEDIDVGYRAKLHGYVNRFAPKALVYHVGSGTSGSRYNEFKIHHSSRNSVYLIYKNMPLWQIILNSPFLLAGYLMKWLFFIKKGFGKEYAKGVCAGISMSRKGEKADFTGVPFTGYLKIQWELWRNILRKF